MIYALAAVMGVGVGLVLGFFGSGGSILAVPMLVYGLGVEAKPAIAMSLVIVGGTALAGFLQQWRQGRVAPGAALLFGGFGLAGSFAGARFSERLSGTQQMLVFGVVMLAASLNMLRSSHRDVGRAAGNGTSISFPVAVTLGSAVGFLTGLIGVGGGFLIVPALVFGGLDVHRAIGTSLLVIVMNCASGVVGYWGRTEFRPELIAAFLVSSTAASIAGARMGVKISAAGMKRGFAVFLLIVAAAILAKNAGGFS